MQRTKRKESWVPLQGAFNIPVSQYPLPLPPAPQNTTGSQLRTNKKLPRTGRRDKSDHLIYLVIFTNRETEAQRGEVTCLGSRSQLVAEPRLELAIPAP